jgi:hypothetical protein
MIGGSEILTEALNKLNKRSESLEKELTTVRTLKTTEKFKA